MITIAVAFVAVEFWKVGLTGEHIILKTFQNVVAIQEKETQKKKKERSFMESRYSCFVECYEVHFVACNLIMNVMWLRGAPYNQTLHKNFVLLRKLEL